MDSNLLVGIVYQIQYNKIPMMYFDWWFPIALVYFAWLVQKQNEKLVSFKYFRSAHFLNVE